MVLLEYIVKYKIYRESVEANKKENAKSNGQPFFPFLKNEEANNNKNEHRNKQKQIILKFGIKENERVQIVNNHNGERLETYAIKGKRGSGIICLNGAAARKAQPGDIVIIISYAWMTPEEAAVHKPIVVFPDENNRVVK